ncbi:MAG: hypothetical protein JWL59_4987 [Chthoniobacteraceae bacterium]|nr:hypothetical protein [Chthoniobacteraceae bacterium]
MCVVSLFNPLNAEAELLVKNGEKIAFLGDSITAQGASSPSGYVWLVMSGLEANGVKATAIGAGIGGHKSNDMLKRLENDVLSKKPDWMTLSCGVNDVWHGEKGVPLEDYKKNITAIVERAQAAGVKVMILTSTMIKEDQANELNQKLAAYNEFLRGLAAEKKCALADLNAEMQEAVKAAAQVGKPKTNGNYLTADGVHMNPAGNQMMAQGVLKGFGLDAAQISKVNEGWQDLPGAVEVGKIKVSLRQNAQLEAIAAKEKRSVESVVNTELARTIDGLLKQSSAK